MPIPAPLIRINERPGGAEGPACQAVSIPDQAHQAVSAPEPPFLVAAVPLNGFVPKAPTLEELQLVQRMFFLAGDEMPRVIVFCGVEAGDGAETVCARTGEVLSCLVNEPVCLMDANLRAPTLHLRYDIDEEAVPFARAAQQSSRGTSPRDSSLWVLPAGALRECRPGFAPDSVRKRLSVLREKFGFLLIAAPPLSTAAEGFLLGQMADGLVLNVMARSTQRAAAIKVRRNLELYNVRLLGAIVNETPERKGRAKEKKDDS